MEDSTASTHNTASAGKGDVAIAARCKEIEVASPSRKYSVYVGNRCVDKISGIIPEDARQVVVVTQREIEIELDLGREYSTVFVSQGEEAKSVKSLERVCKSFVECGLTRRGVVIALGGGVVTDLAGFAASIYHRGVPCINVSTSLIGQVDAAIGGKTGINLEEGKNLIGTFSQPLGVICDISHLESLPQLEMLSGYGEIAKYALLGLDNLEKYSLEEQVAKCVYLKASIVSEDELEQTGKRAVLNYGHTLGHAIEACSLLGSSQTDMENQPIRHGVAVGIGLIFAGKLAHRLGRIDDARLARHYEVVRNYGLMESIPKEIEPDELVQFMAHDKKSMFAKGDGLNFVLDGEKGVELVTGIDTKLVRGLLQEMYSR